jgi:hypothetical protein
VRNLSYQRWVNVPQETHDWLGQGSDFWILRRPCNGSRRESLNVRAWLQNVTSRLRLPELRQQRRRRGDCDVHRLQESIAGMIGAVVHSGPSVQQRNVR